MSDSDEKKNTMDYSKSAIEEQKMANRQRTQARKMFNRALKEVEEILSNPTNKQAHADQQAKLEAEKVVKHDELLRNLQKLKNIRSAEAVSFESEYSRAINLDEESQGRSVIK